MLVIRESILKVEGERGGRKMEQKTMEIKIRVDISDTTASKVEEDQPLSPAARVFNAPVLNCYVIAVLGIKKKIEPDVVMEGLKQSLIRHPRFSSKLVSPTLLHTYN